MWLVKVQEMDLFLIFLAPHKLVVLRPGTEKLFLAMQHISAVSFQLAFLWMVNINSVQTSSYEEKFKHQEVWFYSHVVTENWIWHFSAVHLQFFANSQSYSERITSLFRAMCTNLFLHREASSVVWEQEMSAVVSNHSHIWAGFLRAPNQIIDRESTRSV